MTRYTKWALDPLFLFLVVLTAGTVWILGPLARKAPLPVVHLDVQVPSQLPVAQPAVPISEAAQPDTTVLTAALQALQSTNRDRRTDLASTAAEVDAAQHRIDVLQAELAVIDNQRASLTTVNASPAQSNEADSVQALIARRRQENDRLQSDLERATAPISEEGANAPVLALAKQPLHKLPQPVELLENRITPVTKEYFHFPMFSLKPLFTVKRIRMGETIAEARRPGSEFSKFLATIQPHTLYVSCLLNRDSFQAFYAVREMAAKSGIDVGWEPSATSSGAIPMLGVKLASPSDKKLVRVPDVISQHQDRH